MRATALCALLASVAGTCRDSTAPTGRRSPAALEIVGGDAQEGTVGTELGAPLQLRVRDGRGAPIGGLPVKFRVTSGGGRLASELAFTDLDGLAQNRWTLGTGAAESQQVEASAIDDNTGQAVVTRRLSAVAHAAEPDTVRGIWGGGQHVVTGTTAADSLLVRVVDRFGNPTPGATVTWTAPSEALTLTPPSGHTSATGHASTKLSAGTRAGPYTVIASVRSDTIARSIGFDVRVLAGAPAAVVVAAGDGQSATVTTAVAVDPAVRVLDANGNPIVGAAVDFSTTGGSSLSAASATSDSAGLATVRWTLSRMAGIDTLHASVAGLPGVILTATGLAGPAVQVVKVAGDSQTVLPGAAVPASPAVRVTDAYGNGVAGQPVHFVAVHGGGSVTGGAAVTDAVGLAAAGGWTLGAAKGTNRLSAWPDGLDTVRFTAWAGEYSPDVEVVVRSPTSGRLAGDTLFVSAVGWSSSGVSLSAAVGTRSVSLRLDALRHDQVGALDLRGMPRGALELVVTARSTTGTATDAFVTFMHDAQPTLTVAAPDSEAMARSEIAFAADCTDDDPAGCRSLVVELGGAPRLSAENAEITVATGQGHVGGTLSLRAYEGRELLLTFTAVDGALNRREQRQIYVESSTRLAELGRVPGTLLDFRDDRALYLARSGALFLRDLTTGVTDSIGANSFWDTGRRWPQGFVTDAGAIFFLGKVRLSEWRDGALVDLGTINSTHGLRVSGHYAVFGTGGSPYGNLVRRDLRAGTNLLVSANAHLGCPNGVAPNGDVVFSSSDGRIYRHRDGETTLLTPSDTAGWWRSCPVTDGVNVVYRAERPGAPLRRYDIVLHDGTGETVLSAGGDGILPDSSYAVNGGWTAFEKEYEVWLRSPTGEISQRSSRPDSHRLTALGDDGTVVFRSSTYPPHWWNESNMLGGTTRRYIAPPGGSPQVLMSGLGTVLWRDGRFVALIGRTAFAITP